MNICGKLISLKSLTHTCGSWSKDHTHKTTRVVVSDGLGVTKSFQQRIWLEDDVFYMLQQTCKHSDTVWDTTGMPVHPTAGTSKVSWVIACCLYLNFRSSSRYFGNVSHDVFGSHCLSSTALATATRKTGHNTPQNNTTLLKVHEHMAKHAALQNNTTDPQSKNRPDLMMTHWFSPSIIMFLYMLSVKA